MVAGSRMVKFLTGRSGRSLFRPLMHNRTPIFMLHRLDDPARGVHGHSIDFLRTSLTALRDSGAKFVSLRAIVDAWRSGAPIDPNWVAFTIDDGFIDQADLVREVFAPLECPVTIFLITGFLDKHLWPWDDQLAFILNNASCQKRVRLIIADGQFAFDLTSQSSRDETITHLRNHLKSVTGLDPYAAVDDIARQLDIDVPKQPPPQFQPMSWNTVRELEKLGAEFGPHSITHRIFSKLTNGDSVSELQGSWSRLRQELRNPLPIFAWPTGRAQDFTARDVANAKAAGLWASVSTRPGYAHREPDSCAAEIFMLRRFGMPNRVSMVLRYGSWLERGRELLPI